MEPILQQTYMSPSKSKNKVYFMWDFVRRTLVWLPFKAVFSTGEHPVQREP